MKKFLAVLLVMVLLAWPLSASAATLGTSAATRGYKTSSGTVGGYNYSATLNVSSTSAYATLLATHNSVRITGSASVFNYSTYEYISLSMNASGVDYYVEKTALGNSSLDVRSASTNYYVNNQYAVGLYSPAG